MDNMYLNYLCLYVVKAIYPPYGFSPRLLQEGLTSNPTPENTSKCRLGITIAKGKDLTVLVSENL